MITKETIDNTMTELQKSYLLPADGREPTAFVESYNKTIMSTIENLIKMKLYLRDFGYFEEV